MTGVQITSCSTSQSSGAAPEAGERSAAAPSSGNRVLLAYFSRPGENYFNGGRTDLKIGNAEVLARLISEYIECDVHRIEAVDAYSDDYDETVARNVREQEADARPAIANSLSAIDRYGVVLLGSPIWNVRAPMIMSTFAETYDFRGKTVHPVTTHAMSGLGTTERDYAAVCPGRSSGKGSRCAARKSGRPMPMPRSGRGCGASGLSGTDEVRQGRPLSQVSGTLT
ncbi:flavodoxin [Streptomyces sp. NBC_00576]|uniref:flavodoxin n=1 Tax=Streptomyces sp. NBC_00576 TaxID=2903665 RepID=UPI002E816EFF|nr:flavodoxin [Streptomyces sp. NBC_00576]WUB76191.1 hypothetical protein OG734_42515 [Streptomyces sp. NBC_00576]